MKQLISTFLVLFLSGCQVDPYTHEPTWTSTDWYAAGLDDAISGYVVKDNVTLADSYNDPDVDRRQYLKGYAEGQRKTCQHDFVYARGLAGKTFPSGCDTVENVDQLHSVWQKGTNESAASTRLN
ncbi:MAG: DUF2799 domain-containing protein [Acinetobacter sp.]